MPERLALKRVRSPRVGPHTIVLFLVSAAVLILLGTVVRDQQKTDALATALAAYRQDSERQITELRQAQSVSLEQSQVRLDQLTAQLQKTEEEQQRQVAPPSRTHSEASRRNHGTALRKPWHSTSSSRRTKRRIKLGA